MKVKRNGVIGAAALLVILGSSPTSAQDARDRAVEQFTCKDVMRENGTNRDVAIAFLHGFLLGKSGSLKFNVDVLRTQTDDFIERCLAHPDEKAIDVMSKIKGSQSR